MACRLQLRSVSSFVRSSSTTSSLHTTVTMTANVAFAQPLYLSSSSTLISHGRNHHNLTFPRRSFSSFTLQHQAPKATLRPKIAVVGGGHAGLSTALRLASLPWTRLTRPEITLIDKSDRFVFLPLLYDLTLSQVSTWEIAPKYTDILQDIPYVKFEHANVENIDMQSNAIEGTLVENDKNNFEFRLLFDKAIIAVGAQVANLDKVKGAMEFAYPFYNLNDAIRVKERLQEFKKRSNNNEVINIIVVGGGFSGVELASCIGNDMSGTNCAVMIIENGDALLKNGTDFNRQASINALTSSNVSILYNASVSSINGTEITVTSNDTTVTYPADFVLWTAGNKASEAQSAFSIPLDKQGRIETNEYLQVCNYEKTLYALGDGAVGGGTAQVAVQQAEYAAWNTWAECIGNKKKLKFRYTALGEMMILGKENATVSTLIPGLELSGSAAWIARRLAYLARMPTERHRRMVAASWAVHPLLEGIPNLIKASQQYKVM